MAQAAWAWAWYVSRVPAGSQPSGRLVTGLVGQVGLQSTGPGLEVFLVSPNKAEGAALAGEMPRPPQGQAWDPARSLQWWGASSAHQAGGALSKLLSLASGPQDHLFQVQRSRPQEAQGSLTSLQKGPGTFVLDLGPSSWGPGGTSSPTREAPWLHAP